MVRLTRLLPAALLVALAVAAPAEAARTQLGSLSGTPSRSCFGAVKTSTCTAVGLPITADRAGLITAVRVKHGAPTGSVDFTFRVYDVVPRDSLYTDYRTAAVLGTVAASDGGQSTLTLSTPVAVSGGQWIGVTASGASGAQVDFIAVDPEGSRDECFYASSGDDPDADHWAPYCADRTNALIQADIRTPPATTITGGPSGTVSSRDHRFTYSGDESPVTFECSLDGAAFAACDGAGHDARGLGDGTHRFAVRATNDLGQRGPEAIREFTVDTTPDAPSSSPATPAWGIGFAGQTWKFADAVDSLGGPATDIESVKIVYDAGGRVGVLVRFYGAGAHSFVVSLHRTPNCVDYDAEFWTSHMGDSNTIWATAAMNGVEFVPARTSGDGREVLVTVEDPRVAGLAVRCLSVRSRAGSDTVDTLATSLVNQKPVVFIPPREEIVVILRQSLTPTVRFLVRSTPQAIARKRVHAVRIGAPGPGSVGMDWTVPAKVAKRYGVPVRRGVKKVTLAVGARKTTKAAKRVKVKVKLTREGTKVLRKAKRLKVQVRSGYLAPGGDQLLAATKTVQLGGKAR